ncbi:MAG TPA: hydroxylamine reductase [Candidatus Methanofastidiosa archaeon]|nr:hydroxylamine reductase [Candidatus Methanofastidiosa archaeon]HPR41148.1 hydroxylamine reductase [Candidatus Methanofastidiosa archaeon]
MFCYQCEEALNGEGCTKTGACGKTEQTADIQDKLIFALKGLAHYRNMHSDENREMDTFVMESLFATLTNTNFDSEGLKARIVKTVELRDSIAKGLERPNPPYAATLSLDELMSTDVGVLSESDENIRSLIELITYGVKGLAAYAYHAEMLGYHEDSIAKFIYLALDSTLRNLSMDELISLALECGRHGVEAMSLLDRAHTETYGNPEPTQVFIGTRSNPGILVSGHDLKDLHELLEQTRGTGVDIYTHGEMMPANAYPAFKKYDNLVGNYGGPWHRQREEFESFNGPILMTTNCIVGPKGTYSDRIFTTGAAGYVGVEHIDAVDGAKDFSKIIELARNSKPPRQLEDGTIWTGFAHAAVLSVADKVLTAVKDGKIKRFVVMAGCDGRHKERSYYTEFAKALPKDTIILTAGCAKYRYNKLGLGNIEGIPRVLDAGQCNDSYSLVVVALKLAEALGLNDINLLPISYNIAWYEQKAVLVLLSLLHLGVKNIMLGPRLPAFLSEDVLNVLVNAFGIKLNTNVEHDMKELLN